MPTKPFLRSLDGTLCNIKLNENYIYKSLLLISFIGFSQKIINYDRLLIGRWIEVKDTKDSKSYPKLTLEIEYKTNGELSSYQDGR